MGSSEFNDDYTPLLFGVFMADTVDEEAQAWLASEAEEERIRLEEEHKHREEENAGGKI